MTENLFNKAEDFFVCTECGECCYGYGGTEVDRGDIKKIADFLDIDENKFITRYCIERKKDDFLLKQAESGECIFFKGNCTIHPVKPAMCRDWPFIVNLLKAPENWYLMAGVCKGMKKDVPLDKLSKFMREKNKCCHN